MVITITAAATITAATATDPTSIAATGTAATTTITTTATASATATRQTRAAHQHNGIAGTGSRPPSDRMKIDRIGNRHFPLNPEFRRAGTDNDHAPDPNRQADISTQFAETEPYSPPLLIQTEAQRWRYNSASHDSHSSSTKANRY